MTAERLTSYKSRVENVGVWENRWIDIGAVSVPVVPLVEVDSATAKGRKTPKGRPLFARLSGPDKRAWARARGGRLLVSTEFVEMHELAQERGTELAPVILPTASMRAKTPRKRGESDEQYGRRLYAPMGSLEWCEIHDDLVWDQIEAMMAAGKSGPFTNIGKPEIRKENEHPDRDPPDMCLAGWWLNGKWIQAPNEKPDHDSQHSDYSTTIVVCVPPKGCAVFTSHFEPSAEPKREPWDDDGLFVKAARTPVSIRDVHKALHEAWPIAVGGDPNENAIRVLLAQSEIETGAWRACWNWNLGNVKRVRGHQWTMLGGTWEILNGKKVVFDPPHPQTHFCAFSTIEEGAKWWLKKMQSRFSKSWPAALSGDPSAFSKALKAQHYYTASEADYTRMMVAAFNAIPGKLLDVDAALAQLGYAGDVKGFQRSVGLVADGIVGPKTRAALLAALAGRE